MATLDEFLSEPRNVAVVGIRKDGRPQATPNWFSWDGERFYVSTTRDRAKYKIFSRDPRVELLFDDPEGFRYVALSGTVEILEDVRAELPALSCDPREARPPGDPRRPTGAGPARRGPRPAGDHPERPALDVDHPRPGLACRSRQGLRSGRRTRFARAGCGCGCGCGGGGGGRLGGLIFLPGWPAAWEPGSSREPRSGWRWATRSATAPWSPARRRGGHRPGRADHMLGRVDGRWSQLAEPSHRADHGGGDAQAPAPAAARLRQRSRRPATMMPATSKAVSSLPGSGDTRRARRSWVSRSVMTARLRSPRR